MFLDEKSVSHCEKSSGKAIVKKSLFSFYQSVRKFREDVAVTIFGRVKLSDKLFSKDTKKPTVLVAILNILGKINRI